MMDSPRKYLTMVLTLLVFCELTDAKGLCEFAGMFPNATNGTTCGNVAKVRNHIESTKKLTSTPPTSPTKQEFTEKLTSISPTKKELTSDQQTTKQLTSTPPTSPPCAPNMVLGPSCNCERTCQDPTICDCTGPETCVCPDGFLMNNTECVPEQDCGCYYDGGGLVIPNGDTYINDDCTERCTCSNNQLSCDHAYICGPNAACRVEDGVRQCYCNDGYVGDGETCKQLYTDCYDAYQDGHRQDGVFTILPYGWLGSPFSVWCDMNTSGGGWTIIQRRVNRTYFERFWPGYKDGFESVSISHWLGNDKLFYITNQRNYTLRVDLVNYLGVATYQEYSLFKIANESDNYRLIGLGSSIGTAGDGMAGSLGRQFSIAYGYRDNDRCDDIHCSQEHGWGGWWYSNEWCDECCNSTELTCFPSSNNCTKRCTKANLNGVYYYNNKKNLHKQIFWNDIHSIVSAEMKIRPVNGTV